jgi:hypothetical protein
MSDRPSIILMFQSADLSDDKLQSNVEELLPQLRDISGVADVSLVSVAEAPKNSKAMDGGALVLGALKFTIENSKILTGLLAVGNAIVGNGKTVKISVKASNGNEFSGEAKNLTELEQVQQMAEDFLNRQG